MSTVPIGTAQVIDGRAIADALCTQLQQHVARLQAERGVTPGLAVVMVGDNPASAVYVRNKARQSEALGMRSAVHRLPVETTEAALLATIAALNADPAVHGILVQLPLPRAIDPGTVLATIDPAKDVDGFHLLNAGRLATGTPGGLVPCTPSGCLKLIRSVRRDLAGLRAVIVGRSNIVGKPMALLLLQEDCTVTIAHSKTRDLGGECRNADILVAAVGRAEMIDGRWIKPGAIVIDVGINRVPADGGKSRLVGDVQFAAAAEVAGAITPVPGGVGPMTVACLMLNTVIAACRSQGLAEPAL